MNGATPGQAFRETLHERWAAQGRCIDSRPYDQLPEGDRDDLEAAVQAAMDAGAPKCPNGCGCRLGTEQADQRDCACDGLCCYDEIEVSELFAERDRLKAAIAAQDARPAPEFRQCPNCLASVRFGEPKPATEPKAAPGTPEFDARTAEIRGKGFGFEADARDKLAAETRAAPAKPATRRRTTR